MSPEVLFTSVHWWGHISTALELSRYTCVALNVTETVLVPEAEPNRGVVGPPVAAGNVLAALGAVAHSWHVVEGDDGARTFGIQVAL